MANESELTQIHQDLIRNQKDIADCIRIALVNGKINILYDGKNPVLRIFKNIQPKSYYLTSVSTKDQLKVSDLADGDNPHELFVDANIIDLESIKKALPSFIHDNYPDAANLPIDIFISEEDFKTKKPSTTVDSMPDLASISP